MKRSLPAAALCAALAPCLFFSTHGADGAQTSSPIHVAQKESIAPRPGEITAEEAEKACKAFLKKLALEVPTEKPDAVRLWTGDKPGAPLMLRYREAGFSVVVAARTREVVHYENLSIAMRIHLQQGPGGALAIGDATAALNAAWSVIKRLGVQPDRKLVELNYPFFPGSPGAGGGYPTVRATFQPMPFGYKIRGSLASKSITLDAHDGALIWYTDADYGHALGYTIEASTPKLKLPEALAIAQDVAKKYRVGSLHGKSDGNPQPGVKPSELMFVSPDGAFGGPPYDPRSNPLHLRLAWVFFYPHGQEVDVDASDGRVLGGVSPRMLR